MPWTCGPSRVGFQPFPPTVPQTDRETDRWPARQTGRQDRRVGQAGGRHQGKAETIALGGFGLFGGSSGRGYGVVGSRALAWRGAELCGVSSREGQVTGRSSLCLILLRACRRW